ncbi:hypothetical protein [Neisseria sp. 83E34]|uniref:hypothetical protein n=1 Tax=Neisseria sp. 83E34 TaxID=1692264 RepID=UPI0006CE9BCE|nr:hypothetical protein [Neisseria sp. 83E34]KPN72123.1 hypothetical protein AKG09_02835 [Neisseria sp. 83E34]
MLGLAVLFGLSVWIGLTVLAAYLCGKLTSKLGLGRRIGRFAGFMLLMGGWMVSWAMEYWTVRQTAQTMCKDAGITVYVTPEDWRRRLGYQEWKSFKLVQERVESNEELIFENRVYKISHKFNDRIFLYESHAYKKRVSSYYRIIFDKEDGIVLFKSIRASVSKPAIANSLEGLKFWMETIPDCYKLGDSELLNEYLGL